MVYIFRGKAEVEGNRGLSYCFIFFIMLILNNNNAFIYYLANNQPKVLNVNQGREKEEKEGRGRRPTWIRLKK